MRGDEQLAVGHGDGGIRQQRLFFRFLGSLPCRRASANTGLSSIVTIGSSAFFVDDFPDDVAADVALLGVRVALHPAPDRVGHLLFVGRRWMANIIRSLLGVIGNCMSEMIVTRLPRWAMISLRMSISRAVLVGADRFQHVLEHFIADDRVDQGLRILESVLGSRG